MPRATWQYQSKFQCISTGTEIVLQKFKVLTYLCRCKICTQYSLSTMVKVKDKLNSTKEGNLYDILHNGYYTAIKNNKYDCKYRTKNCYEQLLPQEGTQGKETETKKKVEGKRELLFTINPSVSFNFISCSCITLLLKRSNFKNC